MDDPCAEVTCATGEVCISGTCTEQVCDDVACASGYVCVRGECVFDPCSSVECPVGESCEVDELGQAQCVADWTDGLPESPSGIAGEEAAGDDTPDGELTGGEGGADDLAGDDGGETQGPVIMPGGTFTMNPAPPDHGMNPDSDEGAESVSGCHQRQSTASWIAIWILLMSISVKRRFAQGRSR